MSLANQNAVFPYCTPNDTIIIVCFLLLCNVLSDVAINLLYSFCMNYGQIWLQKRSCYLVRYGTSNVVTACDSGPQSVSTNTQASLSNLFVKLVGHLNQLDPLVATLIHWLACVIKFLMSQGQAMKRRFGTGTKH